jgi:hypothetical protein
MNFRIGIGVPLRRVFGLASSIITKLVYWLGPVVEDGEYPNKIGDQSRTVYKGRALSFNGTNQYASIADNGALDVNQASTDFCISGFITTGSDIASVQMCFGKMALGSTDGRYGFYISASELLFAVDATGGLVNISDNITFAANTKYHVAAHINISTSTVYFYIDGVLQNAGGTSYTGTIPSLSNVFEFYIGSGNEQTGAGPAYHFGGQTEDVRIYHKDVTSAANLAALQKKEELKDEVAWYWNEWTDLLENFDASGNGYHMTNANFDAGSFVENNSQSLINKYGYNKDVNGAELIAGNNLSAFEVVGNATIDSDAQFTVTVQVGSITSDTTVLSLIGRKYSLGVSGFMDTTDMRVQNGTATQTHVSGLSGNVDWSDIITASASTSLMRLRDYGTGQPNVNTGISVTAKPYYDTEVPPDMSTSVNGIPTLDIFGNALVYAGQAQYPAVARDRSVFVGDGVAYWDMDSSVPIDRTKNTVISIRAKLSVASGVSVFIAGVSNTTDVININAGDIYVESNTNGDVAYAALNDYDTDWHTYEITINNSVVSIKQDGVALTMTDNSISDDITFAKIGRFGSSGFYFEGSMSNVAITEDGIALHNYQFTEGNGATVHDVVGTNHLTGVSVAANNWGVESNPTEDYLAEHGGNFAGRFNGVDDYIATTSNINIGKVHTIDIRFRKGATATEYLIGDSASNDQYIAVATNAIIYRISDTNHIFFDTFTEGVWYELQIIRNGTAIECKIDTVSIGTDTIAGPDDVDFEFDEIGRASAATVFFSGLISTIQVTSTVQTSVNYNITGIDFIDTFGTWSGTGVHTSIIPARKDTNLDALGQLLVYGQNGKQVIPHTYLSMAEVRELMDADAAERFEGGLMDTGKGTFDDGTEDYLC